MDENVEDQNKNQLDEGNEESSSLAQSNEEVDVNRNSQEGEGEENQNNNEQDVDQNREDAEVPRESQEENGSQNKSAEPSQNENNEPSQGGEEGDAEVIEEDKSKRKKKKDKKEKKSKKKREGKDKGKKKEREAAFEDLAHDIFGSSDDDEAFDFGAGEVEGGDEKKEGNEDEDYEQESKERLKKLAGRKKRQREKDESSKGRKKGRKSKADETEDVDVEANEEEEEDEEGKTREKAPKEKHFFDEFLDGIRSGRSGKRKKKGDGESLETSQLIDDFKIRMDAAADNDRADNEASKPALNKMKMLAEVQAQLEKKNLHQLYVENHILVSIRKWLEPLPDRSLPNMKIREALLQALHRWGPIETDELKDSGIGRVIMFLSKHPNETAPNKQIAKTLIDRWSRPIFGISEQYKDIQEAVDEEEVRREIRKKELTNSRDNFDLSELAQKRAASSKLPVKDSPTYHARIPDKIALDFKIRPKSKINAEQVQKKQKRGLENRLLLKKGSPSGPTRAISMSIEGRGMSH